MTVGDLQRPTTTRSVGLRTDETDRALRAQDTCVPTRGDWPQEAFAAWLDDTKKRLGLRSDYQLAEHFDIGHTLISGWRNGRQRPSIPTLSRIAAVLQEDPRRLWVLAGAASPADVGLSDAAPPVVQPALPEELQQLIATYFDERLDDRDREAILRHVRILEQTVQADLVAREERDRQVGRRRTGKAS